MNICWRSFALGFMVALAVPAAILLAVYAWVCWTLQPLGDIVI